MIYSRDFFQKVRIETVRDTFDLSSNIVVIQTLKYTSVKEDKPSNS